MRILVTNDDGYLSPALPQLIRFARKFGEVTAVAPMEEQSGKSQAIDFKNAVTVELREIAPDVSVYAMASTPADCVRFGVTALGRDYDLVISGVNRGYNLGDDIAYSGTVGAIMEAARLNINGIAISADPDHLIESLAHLDTVFDFVNRNSLFSYGTLYNVNIPVEPKDFKITSQGGTYYTDDFQVDEFGRYIQVGDPVQRKFDNLGLDIDAVNNGYFSVTPLTASRTDGAVLDRLKALLDQ